MVIVTGGAGFIGSSLVKALNERGITDILVVDNLTNGDKFRNIVDCQIADYLDKQDFIERVRKGQFSLERVEAVFHQGACSDTMVTDGRYMMSNNYEYSKTLLHAATEQKIPFIYASSVAVYGVSRSFREERENEKPVNVYGYSKHLFDRYVRSQAHRFQSPVIGLRYFNVYGPREAQKGRMASTILQFYHQLKSTQTVKLFTGTDGYADGQQQRDFIHVDDVISVNLHFLEQPVRLGIFNVGTGECRSFNDVAHSLIERYGDGAIHYIRFPPALKGSYQSYTKAEIGALRDTGYDQPFMTLEEGIGRYYSWLQAQEMDPNE